MSIDASKVQWDAPPKIDANAVKWDDAPKSDAKSSGIDWLRGIALAGRSIGETAAGSLDMAAMVGNPALALRRLLGKEPGLQENLSQTLDTLGAYKPETKGERLLMDTAGGVYGAGMGGPAKTVAGNVINALAGGAGGLGSGVAREAGAGTGGQIGAGVGASLLTSLLGGGARKAGSTIGNVIDSAFVSGGDKRSAARIANDAAGPVKDQIINELRTGQSAIPGMPLNAGQLATPTGRAEFAGLQKIMDQYSGSPAKALDDMQIAARQSEIAKVAQTPAALDAAEKIRDANAKANYGAAFQKQVRADPALAIISKNPYFQDALPVAFKEAAARGIDPKKNLTEFLHLVKLSMDGELAKTGDGALKGVQKSSVASVKGNLVSWLKNKNSDYEKARSTFAAQSKPINEMQVGQVLEGALNSPLGARENAAAFTKAMTEAPRTIKKATGQSLYDDLSQVLTPQKLQNAKNVEQSLIENADYEKLAKYGLSGARRAMGDAFDPIPNAPLLNRVATIANALIRAAEGKGGKAATESLASMMQTNPKMLADAMEKMKPYERAKFFELVTRAGLSQQQGLLGQN